MQRVKVLRLLSDSDDLKQLEFGMIGSQCGRVEVYNIRSWGSCSSALAC